MSRSHNSPAVSASSITPSDTTVFEVTRGLYVGVAGAVAVRMADGTSVTFGSLAVGIHPLCVDMVKSTGTAATGLIGLR